MPVYGSIASQFNDPGANSLYKALMQKIVEKTGNQTLETSICCS
jgi:methylmalonyl-CoA mutase